LKLERAQKLTEGLSEEKHRWAIDIKNLVSRMELIPGDAIISAGMVSYSGPFTSIYREKLEKIWSQQLKVVGLPHT
jgi:dynein heavy chain